MLKRLKQSVEDHPAAEASPRSTSDRRGGQVIVALSALSAFFLIAALAGALGVGFPSAIATSRQRGMNLAQHFRQNGVTFGRCALCSRRARDRASPRIGRAIRRGRGRPGDLLPTFYPAPPARVLHPGPGYASARRGERGRWRPPLRALDRCPGSCLPGPLGST